MAQTGFTPISIYYSATTTNVPTAGNLVAGELAINTADGILFYKDSAGAVQTLASKSSASGSFTNLAYTGTFTGGTGIVNLGSGQFYKDASGNVGIGTSSPATYGKLVSYGTFGTSAPALSIVNSSAENANNIAETQYWLGNSFSGLVNVAKIGAISGTTGNQYGSLYFSTSSAGAPTERMRIDSSGNVGIGTASPSNLLTLFKNSGAYSLDLNGAGFGTLGRFGVVNVGTDNTTYIGSISNNPFAFYSNAVERMRIDSSGTLLIGRTVGVSATTRLGLDATASIAGFVSETGPTSSVTHGKFFNGNGLVGSIATNASVTLFNTTSDYRLKTVIGAVTNAGQRIDELEPIEYDFKAGGRTRGFLAHQFAEVYPNSVSGKKDAVDEEGKPIYQAMQASTSEVMADLIAEIQSLRKRVAQLESK